MGSIRKQLVMVIEDDEVDRYIVRRKLSTVDESIKIIEFSTGKEALRYFEDKLNQNDAIDLPDLILVDINMPIMDGFTFASSLESLALEAPQLKDISVFVLSSSNNERDVQRSTSIGIIKGYIPKPPSADALQAALLGGA